MSPPATSTNEGLVYGNITTSSSLLPTPTIFLGAPTVYTYTSILSGEKSTATFVPDPREEKYIYRHPTTFVCETQTGGGVY